MPANEITRQDLDDLQITKQRMTEMTLSEVQGTTYDTRNGLQSRKWSQIDRSSLNGTWATFTRS